MRQRNGDPSSLTRVWKLLTRTERVRVTIGTLLVAARAAALTAPPLIVREVLDARGDVDVIARMVIISIALSVGFLTSRIANVWLLSCVGFRLLDRVQRRLFRHFEAQSINYATTIDSGEVTTTLIDDISVLRAAAVHDVTYFVDGIMQALSGAVILFILEPWLALVSYAAAPLILASSMASRRIRQRVLDDQRRHERTQSTIGSDAMSVDARIATKTTGSRLLRDWFDAATRDVRASAARAELASRLSLCPGDLVNAAFTSLLLIYIGLRTTDATPGTLAALFTASAAFLNAVGWLEQNRVQMEAFRSRFGRILAALALTPEIRPGTHVLQAPPRTVTFERVSFRYAPEGAEVLRDLSFAVPAGARVAIVGESGAGKSTISLLANRLYVPTAGRVLVDGVDVNTLAETSLQRIGYMPQQPYICPGTIADNIRFGFVASPAELERAAREAQLHEWINGLPERYATRVGTDGFRLSGGQRQRIALARMLLRQPRLMVLDEPTSALDDRTQKEIHQALARVDGEITTLMIAHRLSTIQTADQILVLREGELVERGTFDELRGRGGPFTSLIDAATF